MSNESLNEKLKKLHEELNIQGSIEKDTKENLLNLMDDIEILLDKESKGDSNSLISSLEKSIDDLEEKYPRITMAIQEILTTLSNMGI